MKRHFKKYLFIPLVLILFSCGPLVNVKRNVRTRLAYDLYVLPLTPSKVNIGYRTIDDDVHEEPERIEDNLEEELLEAICYNFKNKNFFLSVNKIKKRPDAPSGNKVLILKAVNKYIKIDKEYISYLGWLTTEIKIFSADGNIVFEKTYKLEKVKSTLGSSKTLAARLYEKLIFMFINDLEVKLGGLAEYNPQVDEGQRGMHRRGKFWF